MKLLCPILFIFSLLAMTFGAPAPNDEDTTSKPGLGVGSLLAKTLSKVEAPVAGLLPAGLSGLTNGVIGKAALEERLYKKVQVPPLVIVPELDALEELNSVKLSSPEFDDYATKSSKTILVHGSNGTTLLYTIFVSLVRLGLDATINTAKAEAFIFATYRRSHHVMKVILQKDGKETLMLGRLKVGKDDIVVYGPNDYVDLRILKRMQGKRIVDRYILEVDNTRIGRLTANHAYFSKYSLPYQKLMIICAWIILFSGMKETEDENSVVPTKKKGQNKPHRQQPVYDPAAAAAYYNNPAYPTEGPATDLQSLQAAGYDVTGMMAAGFHPLALLAAGYDLAAVQSVGYDHSALQAAGYDAAAMQALSYNYSTTVSQ